MRSTLFGVGAVANSVASSIYDGIYEALGGTCKEKVNLLLQGQYNALERRVSLADL